MCALPLCLPLLPSQAIICKRLIDFEEAGQEDLGPELPQLFAGALNPVASRAQKKVPLPEGLDLEHPFYSSESESDSVRCPAELFLSPSFLASPTAALDLILRVLGAGF